MLRDPVDRLQMVFIVIVALAAVAVAVIGSHIVDRSYDHVKEIKQTKIDGTNDDLSLDIVKNADNAQTILSKSKATPHELRFSDSTITRADLEEFQKQPSLTKLKLLRCDFKSEDFEVLKNSKIKIVSMSDVPVDKRLIDELIAIPKLDAIEMFRCDLTKNALLNLAVSKVRLIKFRKCGETRERIFSKSLLKDLARMPSLVHLELSKNTFEEKALLALVGAQCEALDLSKSNATDVDLEALKNLPRLQYLNVDDCALVTCKGLKAMEQNATLKQVKTDVPSSSCSFAPSSASKFRGNLYRVPPDMQFEKDY